MLTERRKQVLVVGLYALLLVASPLLSWKATYNCLISGAIGLRECCLAQEQVREPDCCVETGPEPEVGLGEIACDCCELVLTRQIPVESLVSQHGPSVGKQLAGLPPPSAKPTPHRPSGEPTRAPAHPPVRAGPELRLLLSSLLF